MMEKVYLTLLKESLTNTLYRMEKKERKSTHYFQIIFTKLSKGIYRMLWFKYF